MCGSYKVGDKVLILNDLKEDLVCLSGVVDDMVRYRGMVATILNVRGNIYTLDIDEGEWEWNVEMFEGLYIPEKHVKEETIKKMLDEADICVSTVFDTTTVVTARLKNGFTITETSGCIDARNYSKEIGAEICMSKIEDKLWMLEGYALNKKLSEGK